MKCCWEGHNFQPLKEEEEEEEGKEEEEIEWFNMPI